MSLAPSLFASPGLSRERSGSISQANPVASSPFGGSSYGAAPPPLSVDRGGYGGGFSELRRRGGREAASGTPTLGNALVASDLARTPASALSYRGGMDSSRGGGGGGGGAWWCCALPGILMLRPE